MLLFDEKEKQLKKGKPEEIVVQHTKDQKTQV